MIILYHPPQLPVSVAPKKMEPGSTGWQSFEKKLRAYIRKRVPTGMEDDIYGDVVLRLVANRNKLLAARQPVAWMYQVTSNVIVDFYRHRIREQEVIPLDNILAEQLVDETSAGQDRADTAELANCVKPLIRNLPLAYREALLLTEIQGVKQVDAARQLGLSVSGMKSRVQRGRKQLKDAILNCCHVRRDLKGRISDFESRSSCCPAIPEIEKQHC